MKKRGEVVKDRIVEVASRLFYEQGYNSTGVNQLIDEAGIAKNSLYHHFDSKTDLLLAYLARLQDNWYREADLFLKQVKDPKKRLLALIDYRIKNQLELNLGGCAFVKINAEAGTTDKRILATARENKDKFKNYIAQMVDQLEPHPTYSKVELSQMIYFLIEGSIISTSIYKNVMEMRAAKKLIEKLL